MTNRRHGFESRSAHVFLHPPLSLLAINAMAAKTCTGKAPVKPRACPLADTVKRKGLDQFLDHPLCVQA